MKTITHEKFQKQPTHNELDLNFTSFCEDPHYTYAHFKINDGNATIAAGLIEDRLHYGISFCSPEDNFNKKVGRGIARRATYRKCSKHRGVYTVPDASLAPGAVLSFDFNSQRRRKQK